MKRPRKRRRPRYCKKCGALLDEAHWKWCESCRHEVAKEYKDCEPSSDYVLNLETTLNLDPSITD